MSNIYWNGEKHAELKREDVTADWINQGGSSTRGLEATNKAFCIWYNGVQTLQSAYSSEMEESMTECATSGWGMGVDDLEEAFEHLVTEGGKWTDDTSSSQTYNGRGIYVSNKAIPPSATNFLKAVDKLTEELSPALQVYSRLSESIKFLANDLFDNGLSTDNSKMNMIKMHIESINNEAKKIKPHMWITQPLIDPIPLAPKKLPNFAKMSKFADRIDPSDAVIHRMAKPVKFIDAVDKIDKSLKMYIKASTTFGDEKVGMAFAGITFALTYVPILGGFYGRMVSEIPGLADNFKQFMFDYTGGYLRPSEAVTKQSVKKEVEKCSVCKKSLGYKIKV